MTTEEKVAELYRMMGEGAMIRFTNYNQIMELTQADVDKFADSGTELLKVEGNHICVAQGSRYNSLLGWKITAWK